MSDVQRLAVRRFRGGPGRAVVALLLAFVVLATACAPAESPEGHFRLVLVGSFGSSVDNPGSGPGQLWHPIGLGVQSDGSIAVAEEANWRVQLFTPLGRPAGFVGGRQGGADTVPGLFRELAHLAIAPNGTTFICDRGDGRIQAFRDGKFMAWWRQTRPIGIAVNPSGTGLYTTDEDNYVRNYDLHGTLLRSWGGFGTDRGMFRGASAVAVGPHGDVFVADTDNNRVQRFTHDGAFVLEWGASPPAYAAGADIGALDQPTAIAVDRDNIVYVGERGNHRIQVFSVDGDVLGLWSAIEVVAAPTWSPRGMAVTSGRMLYVCDYNGNRVYELARIHHSARGALVWP